MHGAENNRMTVLFPGTGSFTFRIENKHKHRDKNEPKCKLQFLIKSPDVQFIKLDNKAYVQAKFDPTRDDDWEINRNGDGYVDTTVNLYCLDYERSKKSLEPLRRETVKFQLNQ